MLFFRKLAVAKLLGIRGGGGVSRISAGNFFSHNAENSHMGESCSVSSLPVIEKVLIRGGRRIKIFRRKFFVSQCRKMS